jgi:general secretion pathway protein N
MLGLQLFLPAGGTPPDVSGLAARRGRPVTIPVPPEYAAILASPLFAPDRRPGPATFAAADGSAPGAASLDGYAAVGAAVGRNLATAVISAPGGVVKTLRLGQSLDGWTLAAVDSRRVVFTRSGARVTLVVGEPATASTAAAVAR